jgi:hypothetical protein
MPLFHDLSIASIALAILCALIITVDLARRPQKMAVMNAVWPATALYGSVFALWFYWRKGRAAQSQPAMHSMHGHMKDSGGHVGEHPQSITPTPTQVTLATSHCGAGCAIADICVESAIFGFGLTLFGASLWASFVYDFIAAWGLGIVFQYYSIKPMRDISAGEAILAAIKADTLSILSFQLGMYAWMAFVYFWLFPSPHLEANQPEYWLMMQVAMLLGFATAWPMNRFLVSAGVKEAM